MWAAKTRAVCGTNQYIYSSASKEHQQLTKAVTHCIAKDVLPIHVVDKVGFCEKVKVMPHKDFFSQIAIPSQSSQY